MFLSCVMKNYKKLIFLCHTACPYGLFGDDCTDECNENCTGCNNVNGLCDRGCNPGWMGDYCDIGRLACIKFVYVVDMIQLYSNYLSIVAIVF